MQPGARCHDIALGLSNREHLINWSHVSQVLAGARRRAGQPSDLDDQPVLGAEPTAVIGSGGIYRNKDGREVNDHVYATFDYPQGRTATFSSIQSNAFDRVSDEFLGTKGTLIIRGRTKRCSSPRGDEKATGVEVRPKTSDPLLDASESRAADAAGRTVTQPAGAPATNARMVMFQIEVAEFCSAVRSDTPLACGPERGLATTRAVLAANRAIDTKTRVELPVTT